MKIKDTPRASAALWNQVHMLSESRIQKTGAGPLLSRRQMPTILSQRKMILSVFAHQAVHHCLMTSKEPLRILGKRSNLSAITTIYRRGFLSFLRNWRKSWRTTLSDSGPTKELARSTYREWSSRTKREPVGPLVAIEHTCRCLFSGDKHLAMRPRFAISIEPRLQKAETLGIRRDSPSAVLRFM